MLSENQIEANPETCLPEYLEGASTKADDFGLWVLCVSGRCSCGNHDWGVAPDWKVPAEWGGGYMTSSCMECLGTMEYSDEWERVDRVVPEYSDLNPRAAENKED